MVKAHSVAKTAVDKVDSSSAVRIEQKACPCWVAVPVARIQQVVSERHKVVSTARVI